MVTVTWHGHSLFQVQGSATVATDPHNGSSLGLPTPRFEADVVTVSHGHEDHVSGLSLFRDATVLTEAAEATVKGVRLKGVGCHHDDDRGRRLGSNVVWSFEVDGVRFTHAGDLGHHLSVRQLSEIGSTDVLFLNTGSNLTLAEENAALLDPRVVVPMHYDVPGIVFQWFKMKTVDEFTGGKQRVVQVGRSHEYAPETLPERPEIHIYAPPKL
jgi:L-ascorbate metabolism protein UlaG (beta-lactamase superfamily)